MTDPVILDAGPALNFFGAGLEHILYAAVTAISGELHMPNVVHEEVKRRSRKDKRFAGVTRRVGRAVSAGNVAILPDEQDPGGALAALAERFQRKLAILAKRGNEPLTGVDLGEAMVMAHAAMLRANGQNAWVIIDEWRAAKVAKDAKIPVITTEVILFKAAKLGLIKNVGEMKKIWEKLRTLDDGLVHWDLVPRLRQAARYGEEAPQPEASE